MPSKEIEPDTARFRPALVEEPDLAPARPAASSANAAPAAQTAVTRLRVMRLLSWSFRRRYLPPSRGRRSAVPACRLPLRSDRPHGLWSAPRSARRAQLRAP